VHGRDGTSRTAALLIWLRSLCLVASRERASERERERESERRNKELERVDDEVEGGKREEPRRSAGFARYRSTNKHTYCHGCFKRFISAQEESNSQA
jgi:hypothetical protein